MNSADGPISQINGNIDAWTAFRKQRAQFYTQQICKEYGITLEQQETICGEGLMSD